MLRETFRRARWYEQSKVGDRGDVVLLTGAHDLRAEAHRIIERIK